MTTVALDDDLMDQAREAGCHQSNEDAVTAALLEYVRRHRQAKTISLFGTVEFAADYDHKRERHR
ncbi:MAG: type II toxin-antitoxin system VapB family antitoxin [Planctomycetaceae bacterium]